MMDDEQFLDPFDDDQFDDDDWPESVACGCKYCRCPNDTIAGETCSMCLGGAHQG